MPIVSRTFVKNKSVDGCRRAHHQLFAETFSRTLFTEKILQQHSAVFLLVLGRVFFGAPYSTKPAYVSLILGRMGFVAPSLFHVDLFFLDDIICFHSNNLRLQASSHINMTASASSSGRLLLPGQPVCVASSSKSQLELGTGTYSRGDYILSSLVGYESRTPSSSKSKEIVSVAGVENRYVVPRPDSTVIARVTRVTPRQAYLSILIVDGQPCGSSCSTSSTFVQSGLGNHAAGEGEGVDFQGVVRSQDVRSTEKDKVKLADCFRPGDIVRATVISLGDARSYYLSTAGNELGVIYALSATSASGNQGQASAAAGGAGWNVNGNPMVPISWNQMIDPVTGVVENRKCAKPASI